MLLLVGLVAINLRSVIAAPAPLLTQMRGDLGLSEASMGALVSLPVLCFALAAPLAGVLVRYVGAQRALLAGLVVVVVATAARPMGSVALLIAGTLLVGVGVTVGNVVMPALVKRDLPHRAPAGTSIFTAGMCIGAAAAAGLTPLLAQTTGWRLALASWALPAAVAAAAWVLVLGAPSDTELRASLPPPGPHRRLAAHPLAWAVAIFLGAQSWSYFSLTTWLPTYLTQEAATSVTTSGLALSLYQVLGIAGSIAVAPLVRRWGSQVPLTVGVSLCWGATTLGLVAVPAMWPLWTVLGGVTHGAGITVAMILVVLRAESARSVESLSSMAQLIGYGVGAIGPFAVGAVLGLTGSWTWSLSLVIAASVVMLLAGFVAGRSVTVESARR
ncbi:CP family cyanate transporter-like MFS transporter [Nocardioides massiliensis]|uniref:CP family cyanate transporter-like MFS transporter n=2 Tax=Nocardioides massiliensis TaxID=1325935 RepID=A0ABT9NLC5_9ACTN|nr:MFS transporter [Nocardioides massiliensis]MDP9821146.1 CP family cyanate transporter-like MFS transporter [Nocardioides massiliensis]